MASQKAPRPGKEWYSVSVETLRGVGLLVLLLAVVVLGWFGYRIYERRALEREAEKVLAETQGLIGRLQEWEERTDGFGPEYQAAWKSFQEGRAFHEAGEFSQALAKAKWSYGVLASILDALAVPGSAGQAQFITVQGDVEYRRGSGGDWEEARPRLALQPGDFVRTGGRGSAEIRFSDGTNYTVRANTQFIVSGRSAAGGAAEQSIEMEYGWVDLSTSQKSSNVKTPGAVARVKEDSEAFVTVDKGSSRGRFGALRGGMQLSAAGGLTREVGPLQQVVQTGQLLSEPMALPPMPELVEPGNNMVVDLDRVQKLTLAWQPVPGAGRYALQVSRNHLFVDNVIDAENRTKTRATLGVRGEGTFQWRVAAYGTSGLGPWSKPRRFRVASFRGSGGEKDSTPPALDLEDVKSYGSIFIVAGRSEPGTRIEVNAEQVKVEADGSFTKTVQLTKEGWSFIEIRARDGWGNETVRRHRVFVENP